MDKELIYIAKNAGQKILEIYNQPNYKVDIKIDNSPVTEADVQAHAIIKKGLESFGFPILSEEGIHTEYEKRKNWDKFWLVDPLDGTKEFIKKNGEFTVNIALIEDGKPTFGIVYVPVLDTIYLGGNNYKAKKISPIGETDMPRNINKSLGETIENFGLKVFGSRSHMNSQTNDFINNLNAPILQTMGSSLKFMKIAEGKADLYPRFAPTMEWDTAASHAVLNSLGHKILQLDSSEELIYNKENLQNPYFICY